MRLKIFIIIMVSLLGYVFCPFVIAGTVNDLLLLPSQPFSPPGRSMYMDVVDAGKRLIAVGEWGHIIYSDDRGESWKQAEVPVSVTLTAVCFPSEQQGWAVGCDSVVLHSSDYGKTWQKQLDGSMINQPILDQVELILRKKNDELDSATEEERPRLEMELDDLRYFRNDIKIAVREGPTRPFLDVRFKNERQGLVIGAFGMILRTEDGGRSWLPILDKINNPNGLGYYGMTSAGKTLFLVGERGMIFRSDDDGDSWQQLESPYEGSFFGVAAAPDGGVVVVFGLRGNTFQSTDGGQSWLRLANPRGTSLQAGTFLADNTLVIVGTAASLLYCQRGETGLRSQATGFPGGTSVIGLGGRQLLLGGIGGIKKITLISGNEGSK